MQNHSNSGFLKALKATSSLHIPNHVFGGPNNEIAIASRPCFGPPQLSPSDRYKHHPHHHLNVATIIIILIAITYHLGFWLAVCMHYLLEWIGNHCCDRGQHYTSLVAFVHKGADFPIIQTKYVSCSLPMSDSLWTRTFQQFPSLLMFLFVFLLTCPPALVIIGVKTVRDPSTAPRKAWNMFDIVLATVSWVDVFISQVGWCNVSERD